VTATTGCIPETLVPLGPNPVATHVEAVGQDTPSRPPTAVGTDREIQLCPPSAVVRINRSRRPLASIPPPTATQRAAVGQEIAFRKVAPGGSDPTVQSLPPSAVLRM